MRITKNLLEVVIFLVRDPCKPRLKKAISPIRSHGAKEKLLLCYCRRLNFWGSRERPRQSSISLDALKVSLLLRECGSKEDYPQRTITSSPTFKSLASFRFVSEAFV